MNPKEYLRLKEELIGKGYEREIKWCQELGPCPNPFRFFIEYTWVVLNSGMKNQVAEKIFKKIIDSINENGNPNKIGEVFRHRAKVLGIKETWAHKNEWFLKFQDLCRDIKELQEMEEPVEEADL